MRSGNAPHVQLHRTGDFIFVLWHGNHMKAMRQILSDRVLATALAVALAYLLAFQGFTGNLARASTSVVVQDQLHVMCGASGVFDAAPAGADNPFKRSVECPCATLCRLASSVAGAILTPSILLQPSATATSERITFPGLSTPVQAPRHISPDARGPPFVS